VKLSSSSGSSQTNLETRQRGIFPLALAMAIPGATLADPAHARGGTVYLLTHVVVMPNAFDSGALTELAAIVDQMSGESAIIVL
jgi:hypothetical protein